MYKLILIDYFDKEFSAYETKDIFNIDCITGEYTNKEELLEKMGIKFNKSFKDVKIKSSFNNKEKYISDIMYVNNYLPEQELLAIRYSTFLFDDKSRILKSFIYNIPKFKDTNVNSIEYFDLLGALTKYMNSYRTKRDCYFQLVNYGYLKLKKANPLEEDYLNSIINNIDTDAGTDEDIIIDKIRKGEIEPNYYDLDEYLSMKRYKKR